MDHIRNLTVSLAFCRTRLIRFKWFWYEHTVMRVWYAKDQGLYAIACDMEANERYGIQMGSIELRMWQMRCYSRGFLKGLLVRALPDHFVEQWFQPVIVQ